MKNTKLSFNLDELPCYAISHKNGRKTLEMDDIKKTYSEFTTSRKAIAADRYRPLYHFTAIEGQLCDPNGLCFFKGYWHLFYQRNLGNGWFWGHTISTDCVHWQDLPNAITPDKWETECWSGAVMVEGERAIAVYYSCDRGIVVAVSEDPLLIEWKKVLPDRATIPIPTDPENKRKYVVFDPCIWKKGDNYYVLSGKFRLDPITREREREVFLFTSKDLIHWEYLHPFLENDIFAKHSDDCACPYFVPIGDKHALIHFSHSSGPKYMLGYYDTERDKFRPFEGKSLTSSNSFFGGLHAPSTFPESCDSLRLIYNVNYTKITDQGLDMIMSLPMTVGFLDEDEHELAIRPVKELASLRDKIIYECEDKKLDANKECVLDGLNVDSGEIVMEFENKCIPALEIRVLRSADEEEYTDILFYRQRGDVYYKKKKPGLSFRDASQSVMVLNTLHSTLAPTSLRTPETQQFYMDPEEKLTLRIFIDKSIVEVFANDKIVCAARVYPTKENATGISVRAVGEGIIMEHVTAYSLTPIFE